MSRSIMKKLPREFFNQNTIKVARALLGKILVRQINGTKKIGRIVEVEAYIGEQDLAAHCSKGRTKRTEIMFGPPGHAYVYLIYGMYHCVNVVTEEEGHASAVLIRALEPIKPLTMRTKGPGLLCRAMDITLDLNGEDLIRSKQFYVLDAPPIGPSSIVARPRVGVDYAGIWKDKPLRYYIKGNPFISKP